MMFPEQLNLGRKSQTSTDTHIYLYVWRLFHLFIYFLVQPVSRGFLFLKMLSMICVKQNSIKLQPYSPGLGSPPQPLPL